MSIIRNQEKELAELDYQLHFEANENELDQLIWELKEMFTEGEWLTDVKLATVFLNNVYISDKGVIIICRLNREITDLSIWQEGRKIYDELSAAVDGLSEKDISLYFLLNPPISQQVDYALFQPASEYIIPIKNLKDTLAADLAQRSVVFDTEDIRLIYSFFTGDILQDNNKVLEPGYIKVRGSNRVRSLVNADRYLKFALFGGLFGLHKLYAKSYMTFLAYLFTCAFCGVCWIIDLLEIYMGISKDKQKAYIGPYGDQKNLVFIPVGMYAAFLVVVFVVL